MTNKKVSLLIVILTIFSWFIIFLFAAWLLLSVTWYMLAKIWLVELFIPITVTHTVHNLFLVLIWICLIFIFFQFLKYYSVKQINRECLTNSPTFYQKEMNLNWSVMTYSSLNDKYTNNNIIVDDALSVSQLLSYGVSMDEKKDYVQALSAFRMLIDHPEATIITKQIAECRLMQIWTHVYRADC